MPRYRYRAYDGAGALTAGEIEAPSREAAVAALFRSGLYPLEAGEGAATGEGAGGPRWWERELTGSRRLSRAGLALLTRELATLVEAQLPLDEALRIIALQPMTAARTRAVVQRVLARVLDGASLSKALAAEGDAFPPYYCSMVEAGEASGSLGSVLGDLAGLLERSAELGSRLGAALVYPVILLVAALVAVGVVAAVLLPTIVPLFKDAGAEPPLIARLLLGAEALVAGWWPLVLALLAGLAGGTIAAARAEPVRLWRDRLALRLPLVSGLIERAETGRMARTLAVLVRSGVPLLEALGIVTSVLRNRLFRASLAEATVEVREGISLSRALARSGLHSELTLRLVAAGEQTGELETMLLQVAVINEGQLQRQVERLATLVTPALTLLIGLLVGGLILSVMGAIAGINELAVR